MKKKSTRRTRVIIPAILSIVLILGGCGGMKKASGEFDEDTVKKAAEEVIALVNDKDFEGVEARVPEEYQSSLSAEVLKNAFSESLEKLGAFQEYKSETVMGGEDENYDGDMAITMVTAEYENGSVTYTLTFDTDYKLIGIYMK